MLSHAPPGRPRLGLCVMTAAAAIPAGGICAVLNVCSARVMRWLRAQCRSGYYLVLPAGVLQDSSEDDDSLEGFGQRKSSGHRSSGSIIRVLLLLLLLLDAGIAQARTAQAGVLSLRLK